MAQYINTNIAALTSQQSLSKSQSSLATSLQRLSSGLRINSAADDAAGMAIASRMTSQINGLNQAARNANDGISLAQTASGALSAVTDNLQTMRTLAVQASNASTSASDRLSINNQISQLSAEIQRVATTTQFNGTTLLDGSFNSQTFQVGANQGQTISINSIASIQTSQLGSVGSTYASTSTGTVTTKALNSGDLTLNGAQVGASQIGAGAGQSASSAYSIAAAINAANTGVTAAANTTTVTGQAAAGFTSVAAGSFAINGISVGAIAAGGNAIGQGANVAAAINLVSSQSGVTASANATSGVVTLTATDGRNINVTATNTYGSAGTTFYTAASLLTATGLGGAATTATTDVTSGTAIAGVTTTSLVVNGITITGVTSANAVTNANNFVSAFNTAAAATSNAGTLAGLSASADANGAITLSNNGTQQSMSISAGANVSIVAGTYSSQHGTVTLNSTSSTGIELSGGAVASGGFTAGLTSAALSSNVSSVAAINVQTITGAQSAIATIDGALAIVSAAQAALGAYQNRFTSAVSNMQTAVLNLTASRSRIQDTDFAAETGNLTRAQILQQAGTAMLAQANSTPNGVLALLR
jgi:flagellin